MSEKPGMLGNLTAVREMSGKARRQGKLSVAYLKFGAVQWDMVENMDSGLVSACLLPKCDNQKVPYLWRDLGLFHGSFVPSPHPIRHLDSAILA